MKYDRKTLMDHSCQRMYDVLDSVTAQVYNNNDFTRYVYSYYRNSVPCVELVFVFLDKLKSDMKMAEKLAELCVENRSIRVLDKVNRLDGDLLDTNRTE